MKFVVAAVMVCVCVGAALADLPQWGGDGHGHHFKFSKGQEEMYEACITELKVEKGKHGFPKKDDPNVKCIPRCTMMKEGKVLESGEPVLGKYAPEIQANVTTCYEKVKSKPECEREMSMQICVFNATAQHNVQMSKTCQHETNTELPKFNFHGMGNMTHWNKTGGKPHHDGKGNKTNGACPWKDDKYACYNRCIMVKKGRITEDNEIVKENLQSIVDKKNKNVDIDAIITDCTKDADKDADKCKEAVRRSVCVWDKIMTQGCDFKEGAIDEGETGDEDVSAAVEP